MNPENCPLCESRPVMVRMPSIGKFICGECFNKIYLEQQQKKFTEMKNYIKESNNAVD